MANDQSQNELVLPPNTFAYVLDTTKGRVSIYVGPHKSSMAGTDRPVRWDHTQKKFIQVSGMDDIIQPWPVAAEGQYVVLNNPAPSGKEPPKGTATDAADLLTGRRINIEGPTSFPLWPGQTAQVIDGHRLRNDQYLIVRIYDEEQAQANWGSAVVKKAVTAETEKPSEETPIGGDQPAAEETQPLSEPPALTMGQLLVIKGTDVSFYIPPTGIEVVVDDEGNFVREALSLEQLEYGVLLDENGERRFVRGPSVVFPKPTEVFTTDELGGRKFPAISLTPQSGIYVKVIADYAERGVAHKTGDELFITGKDQPIYFPRPEHQIIEYGGRQIHHATALPEGEGRYVLDRDKGNVGLERGPQMLLPDPRKKVIVRRILSRIMVELLYPGNAEAIRVNEEFKQQQAGETGGGDALVSNESLGYLAQNSIGDEAGARGFSASSDNRSVGSGRNRRLSNAPASERSERVQGQILKRSTNYTPPRTVTLGSKYDGAVAINIFPGYAVSIAKKTGARRVEVGPKLVLLEYDEEPTAIELSTGRPKSEKNLFKTAYLRVLNNQVSDIIEVETRDLVKLNVEVSYRVNFEGTTQEQMQRWFSVENYVKILTDHCRSRVRAVVKGLGIQDFYDNPVAVIRDTLLGASTGDGKPRIGLTFAENGMRVYDVEVLNTEIKDRAVAALLSEAQSTALSGAIGVAQAVQRAEHTARLEEMKRRELVEKDRTQEVVVDIQKAAAERLLQAALDELEGEVQTLAQRQITQERELALVKERTAQEIELVRLADQQIIDRAKEEAEIFTKRLAAISPALTTTLQAFSDRQMVVELVQAVAPAAMAAGLTTADFINQIFKGTPLAPITEALAARPLAHGGMAASAARTTERIERDR